MNRWKSYLKGLKVKLLWHLSLKTSLGSWSLSCAGKHCLFKRFWDAWRGAYNRACWGWKELDFILHWHLQIAKRNVAKWQSLFLETLPMKKTRNLPWKKSGQKDKTKLTSSSSRKIQTRKERWKDATSNLSDLIFDLRTIIFRNNYNIKIMEKHLYWQDDAVRNCKPPKNNCRNEISCRCVFYLRRIIFSLLHSFTCD